MTEEEKLAQSVNSIEVSQEADNKAFEKDPDIIKGDGDDTPYVIGVDDIPPSYNGYESLKIGGSGSGQPHGDVEGGSLRHRATSQGSADRNSGSLAGDPDGPEHVPGWSPEGPVAVDEVLFSTAL